MLTNANVEFASNVIVNGGGVCQPPPNSRDVTLSYLPLGHVAEHAVTTWTNAISGGHRSLRHIRRYRHHQPARSAAHTLVAVPRIWEKLKAGIQVRTLAAAPISPEVFYFFFTMGVVINE